eukprot:jgi/Bigna1/80378/fgenesh1_pg.70_\
MRKTMKHLTENLSAQSLSKINLALDLVSRNPISVLAIALVYLERLLKILDRGNSDCTELSDLKILVTSKLKELFMSLLILASKQLDDRSHSNKHYIKASTLKLKTFNAMEVALLKILKYRMMVCSYDWSRYCSMAITLRSTTMLNKTNGQSKLPIIHGEPS